MKENISRRDLLKWGAAAAAGLATPGLLAGCGSTPAPTAAATAVPTVGPTAPPQAVDFSLWYRYFWEPVKTTFEGLVDQFTLKNPNITLEKNFFGDEDYKSTIKVAMASDNPPDLFYGYGGNWLKFLVEEGLVADVSAYYDQYKWLDRLNERAAKLITIGGKHYSVPTELCTAGIYYNKDILTQVGIEPPEVVTWDEFLGYCEKIKAAGFLPMCLGNKEGGWTQWWWDYSVARENGNDYRKKVVRGEIPLNDKGVIAGLERMWTDIFMHPGYMNEGINGLDIFGWLGLMASGTVGMTLIHHFVPLQLLPQLWGDKPFEIGFFMYPQVHKDIPIANDLYVEGVQAISQNNPAPDEGAKWLDYIISAEAQKAWAAIDWFPTIKGAEADLPDLSKQIFATVEKYDAFAHLDLEFHPEVVTAIFSNIQAVLNGSQTLQQAMDNAQKVADTVPWVGVPQGEA
jgi:raffinose/stachyose/melibiose transport system substrate-binding protein